MAKSKYIETLEEQYTKKDAKSVLRYKAPDNKWRYIQSSKTPNGGNPMPSGGGMVEVKWQELKDKRDNGELVAGTLYRITDYNCTTTQENTQSAGHQFDIVLLALSEDKLAEEGWAMMHDNIYDVTFTDGSAKCYYNHYQDNEGDWHDIFVNVDTLLGFDNVSGDQEDAMEPFIDETNKSIDVSSTGMPIEVLAEPDLPYNYFQNSNLSAWKVWYCLDNDKSRFAWADDSVDEGIYTISDVWAVRDKTKDITGAFAWYSDEEEVTYFTSTPTPKVGDSAWVDGNSSFSIPAIKGFGRGVIYRLIDEWNNDCPYDFKNITYQLDPEFTLYTFSDFDLNEPSPSTDYSLSGSVVNVKMGNYKDSERETIDDNIVFLNILPGNIYITNGVEDPYCTDVIFYDGARSNELLGYISNLQINLTSSSLNTVTDSSFGRNNPNLGGLEISDTSYLNYGNGGVELATKDDIGDIETALNNI